MIIEEKAMCKTKALICQRETKRGGWTLLIKRKLLPMSKFFTEIQSAFLNIHFGKELKYGL